MSPLRPILGSLLAWLCIGCSPDPGTPTVEGPEGQAQIEPGQSFRCSMHPDVVTDDEPGTCGICGMDLVPMAAVVPRPEPLPTVDLGCSGATCQLEAVQRLLAAASESDDAMLVALTVPTVTDEQLPDLLADKRGLVRLYAAVETQDRYSDEFLSLLRSAARDDRDDPQGLARLAAIGALADLRDEETWRLLQPWLSDERPMVRTVALAYADDHRELREVVAEMYERDPSDDVRSQGEITLALMGDSAAREKVLARTDQASFGAQMKLDPEHTRQELLDVLGATVRDDPELDFIVRSSAATALLEARDERGRAAIHEMLATANAAHQLALLQFLRGFASRKDLTLVEALLASPDESVRVQAAAIWLRLNPSEGPPLELIGRERTPNEKTMCVIGISDHDGEPGFNYDIALGAPDAQGRAPILQVTLMPPIPAGPSALIKTAHVLETPSNFWDRRIVDSEGREYVAHVSPRSVDLSSWPLSIRFIGPRPDNGERIGEYELRPEEPEHGPGWDAGCWLRLYGPGIEAGCAFLYDGAVGKCIETYRRRFPNPHPPE